MSVSRWIAPVVESALNAAIELDEDAGARLERMTDGSLEVRVTGTGLNLFVAPAGDRVRVTAEPAGEAAVRISGPPASLARLATTAGTRVLFGGSLHVDGDVAAAKAWKRLFDTLDPDWEEAFARIVGDIPAHEGARAAHAVADAFRRAVDGRRMDLRAWLVDEIEALPARAEVDEWLAQVDRLRADGDRMAARVARLERRCREVGP
jgi:ubiquinone biosynthesis protein UbiJ